MSDYDEVREMYELSASEGVQAIVEAADERIASLEAENERLKVCGNCNHIDPWWDEISCESGCWIHTMPSGHSFETSSVGFDDHCHFTPSRWADVRPMSSHR